MYHQEAMYVNKQLERKKALLEVQQPKRAESCVCSFSFPFPSFSFPLFQSFCRRTETLPVLTVMLLEWQSRRAIHSMVFCF